MAFLFLMNPFKEKSASLMLLTALLMAWSLIIGEITKASLILIKKLLRRLKTLILKLP